MRTHWVSASTLVVCWSFAGCHGDNGVMSTAAGSGGNGGSDSGSTSSSASSGEGSSSSSATASHSSSSTGAGGQGQASGVVAVTPKAAPLAIGATLKLTATIDGKLGKIDWSVVEASGCGDITSDGSYTAPAAIPAPGWCHVKATNANDATRSDTATLTITSGATSGAPGSWTNVTPSSVNLDPSADQNGNFGVLDIVADPARASDLYAFICYQGIWRSTDYGVTWKKVSTGQMGSVLDGGRPWTAAIDPNPTRDPSTPPALYTANGYGSVLGVYKSTDWGVNWTHYSLPGDAAGQDVYAFDIDPYDSNHIITGFHENPQFAESTDGGATWKYITTPSNFGVSVYPHFVDTGDPATTHTTWLGISQSSGGTTGLWKTTDRGAHWTQVESLEHNHGGSQMFQSGPNVVYAAGQYGSKGHGVYRSDDGGSTWAFAFTMSISETVVYGTPNFIYAASGGASMGMIDPSLMRAPRAAGTPWSAMTAPQAMSNGPKRVAVTSDGSHSIIVSGNWLAGIWRYVE